MKYFFLFIFQLCLPFLSAQATINGTLVDSTLTALPGANVVLLNAADSILVSFSNTDNQGRFQINDVPTGEYLLRCSFLGYTRPEQSIIVQASDQLLGLGELIMYPADYFLQGIEVNGHRIPIRMRGDTMVFDADAFGTGPNAVVEDLLRRLPGMTVENDGRILFRGKPVNELMVNGKPFFRGNTQIVTQNLDAAAIKNVEVFDQKSDREIVSGVEDGQEDITVNLEIKEEAKGKIFGQLYAGGGSNERYQAGGKAFRIGDRSQFGALGLFNNLNTVGFSANTALGWDTGSNFSFGGDQRDGQLPVSWGGQPAGENRTLSTGLNYGSSIGKRSNFSAAYILLNRRQQLSENQIDLFSGELEGRRNELNKISQYRVYSHRLSLDFDAKADTTSSFRADLAAFVTGQRNRQDAAGQISAPDLTTIDYSQQDFSRQESPTLSSRLSFTRRLGKAGNTLSVEQRNRIGDPEQSQESLIEGVAAPNGITGFNTDGDSRQWFADQQFQSSGKLSFTRLVSKKMRWQSSVAYDFQRYRRQATVELTDDVQEDYLLSNRQREYSFSSSIRIDFGFKNNLRLGGNLIALDWALSEDLERREKLRWLLPDLQLSFNGDRSRLLLFLNAAPRVPANYQLQTIADPQSVISLQLGNPGLTPEVDYRLYGYYDFSDQYSGFSLNLNVSGNYVDQVIGQDLAFLNGRQVRQFVNLSHQWRQVGNFRIDQRLDFIEAMIGINTEAIFTSGPSVLNNQKVASHTARYSVKVHATKNINDKSFLRLEYQSGRTRNNFGGGENSALTTAFTNLSAVLQIEFSPRWRFETDFGHTSYSNDLFVSDGDLTQWNTSLEVRPFKQSPHYITLAAQDLLNQNRTISRQAFPLYTRSTGTNALGRYFLLSFHWKI